MAAGSSQKARPAHQIREINYAKPLAPRAPAALPANLRALEALVAAKVRKMPTVGPEVGPTTAFSSCVPIGMQWANFHLLGQPNTFLAPDLQE